MDWGRADSGRGCQEKGENAKKNAIFFPSDTGNPSLFIYFALFAGATPSTDSYIVESRSAHILYCIHAQHPWSLASALPPESCKGFSLATTLAAKSCVCPQQKLIVSSFWCHACFAVAPVLMRYWMTIKCSNITGCENGGGTSGRKKKQQFFPRFIPEIISSDCKAWKTNSNTTSCEFCQQKINSFGHFLEEYRGWEQKGRQVFFCGPLRIEGRVTCICIRRLFLNFFFNFFFLKLTFLANYSFASPNLPKEQLREWNEKIQMYGC